MNDLDNPQQRWVDWVASACAAVGVEPTAVDIAELHHLSKHVAHRLERPLAPVSTFIFGLALGAAGGSPGLGRVDLLQRILATLPTEEPVHQDHPQGRAS